MKLQYTITNKKYSVDLIVQRSEINDKYVVIDLYSPMDFRAQLIKVCVGKEINTLLTQMSVWNMIDNLQIKIVGIESIVGFFSKINSLIYNPYGKVVHKRYEPLVLRKDLQIERLNIRKNYHPLNPLGMDSPAVQINKPESAYYKKIFKLEL